MSVTGPELSTLGGSFSGLGVPSILPGLRNGSYLRWEIRWRRFVVPVAPFVPSSSASFASSGPRLLRRFLPVAAGAVAGARARAVFGRHRTTAGQIHHDVAALMSHGTALMIFVTSHPRKARWWILSPQHHPPPPSASPTATQLPVAAFKINPPSRKRSFKIKVESPLHLCRDCTHT